MRDSCNTPFSVFELDQRASTGNDVAPLANARLVTASEANIGVRLNKARLKALTGNDPISARYLYGEFFTFYSLLPTPYSLLPTPKPSSGWQ